MNHIALDQKMNRPLLFAGLFFLWHHIRLVKYINRDTTEFEKTAKNIKFSAQASFIISMKGLVN
jgi:hypothetical protein